MVTHGSCRWAARFFMRMKFWRGTPLNSGLSSPPAGIAVRTSESRLGDNGLRTFSSRLEKGSSLRGCAAIHRTGGSRDYFICYGTLCLSGLGYQPAADPSRDLVMQGILLRGVVQLSCRLSRFPPERSADSVGGSCPHNREGFLAPKTPIEDGRHVV